jgi:hypothetical protein
LVGPQEPTWGEVVGWKNAVNTGLWVDFWLRFLSCAALHLKMSRYDPNSAQASRVPVKFCKSFPGVEDADYDGHSLSMLQRIASALGNRFPSPLWQKPASRLLPRTVWPPHSAVWKSKKYVGASQTWSVAAKHGPWQTTQALWQTTQTLWRMTQTLTRMNEVVRLGNDVTQF